MPLCNASIHLQCNLFLLTHSLPTDDSVHHLALTSIVADLSQCLVIITLIISLSLISSAGLVSLCCVYRGNIRPVLIDVRRVSFQSVTQSPQSKLMLRFLPIDLLLYRFLPQWSLLHLVSRGCRYQLGNWGASFMDSLHG